MSTRQSVGIDPLAAAREFTPILKALADENRLAILLLLAQRPRTVVELAVELGIGQTLASHHLKALRDSAIVVATPEGRSNRYAICCDAIAEPIRSLAHIVTSAPST
ncbi:MAG: ArsR/SmtB family transcription factor [Acidimicrobiales bacterium]